MQAKQHYQQTLALSMLRGWKKHILKRKRENEIQILYAQQRDLLFLEDAWITLKSLLHRRIVIRRALSHWTGQILSKVCVPSFTNHHWFVLH
jgi:hypothetical protein